MSQTIRNAHTEFPALRQLRLTEQALAALRTQGFVRAEPHGRKQIYKLRFRLDGRQRVRFLGDDEELARAVQDELEKIQREVRDRREFANLRRRTRRTLSESKFALEGLLEEHGFHFHGQAIRKRRRPKARG
jgi:hypothetical protein